MTWTSSGPPWAFGKGRTIPGSTGFAEHQLDRNGPGWRVRALRFCLASVAVYAVFNPLAMLLYPGGTLIDQHAEGYSFLGNFFSDLGMAHTYAGEAKVLSLILFASALALIGVAFLLFFAMMPSFFNRTGLERLASRLGAMTGVLAGISCIGIAATPWDLRLDLHMVFSYSLSVSFLLAVVCYLVAILKKRDYPNAYAVVFVVYLIILTAFLGLMAVGPGSDTRQGLVMLAVGQKIAIYSGIMCWSVQFLGALAYERGHSA